MMLASGEWFGTKVGYIPISGDVNELDPSLVHVLLQKRQPYSHVFHPLRGVCGSSGVCCM